MHRSMATAELSYYVMTAELSYYVMTAELSYYVMTAELSYCVMTAELSYYVMTAELSYYVMTAELSYYVMTAKLGYYVILQILKTKEWILHRYITEDVLKERSRMSGECKILLSYRAYMFSSAVTSHRVHTSLYSTACRRHCHVSHGNVKTFCSTTHLSIAQHVGVTVMFCHGNVKMFCSAS